MTARFSIILTVCLIALAVPLSAAETATWAGMTLVDPTEAQLTEIEAAYGEPAGIVVQEVAADSMAAVSGIAAGDVLMCVRMPEETDWYPIPDAASMAQWAAGDDAAPNEHMRLMLLRKVGGEWRTLKCWLGKPLGVPVDEGVLAGGDQPATAAAGGLSAANFLSSDPTTVLATAPDGAQLTQQDVDIYCGIMAWSFGTLLTETQKLTTRDALVGFWTEAPPGLTQSFADGVRPVPTFMPQLSEADREVMRQQFAGTLLQMASGMQQHPLGQVIMQVSGSARQVLAGAGTMWEFTQQDADAMIEYLAFQMQISSGVAVTVSESDRAQITQMLTAKYNAAPDTEKQGMAQMDEYWAALRVQWALAQQQATAAAQPQYQSQVQNQWMSQMQQQYPPGDPFWEGYNQMQQWADQNPGSGGGMTPGMMGVYQNMIDMDHATSMNIINNMGSGPTTDVYDSGGSFMYSY